MTEETIALCFYGEDRIELTAIGEAVCAESSEIVIVPEGDPRAEAAAL